MHFLESLWVTVIDKSFRAGERDQTLSGSTSADIDLELDDLQRLFIDCIGINWLNLIYGCAKLVVRQSYVSHGLIEFAEAEMCLRKGRVSPKSRERLCIIGSLPPFQRLNNFTAQGFCFAG